MASNFKVDYNDKQLKAIDKEKNAAIKDSDKTFDGMINETDKAYQDQINATNQWGETQKQLQQERTDFTIEKIEQDKAQANKDFQKEGSAAYVDWQKQSDDYGSNAEKMASMGLASSGYSESSQVAMYNTYQNRVAVARESYNKAVMNYNNMITEAKLQNSSALMEIGFNTLTKSLELTLAGLQSKNTFLLQKADAKSKIEDRYYTKYQDRISQINHENSMAEQNRQFNKQYDLDLKKYKEDVRQYNETLNEEKRQFNENLALQKKNSNVSSSRSSSRKKLTKPTNTVPNPKKDPDTEQPTVYNKKGETVSPSQVIDLGYGPISDKALKNLVQTGAVKVDPKTKTLKKTATAPKKLNNTKAKPTVTSILKRMFG